MILPEPLAITQSPSDAGVLLESTIAPYDSRAKVNFSGNSGRGAAIDFWYYCNVESPFGALLHVTAPLTLNGWIGAMCASGSIFGSEQLFFGMNGYVQVYDQGAAGAGQTLAFEHLLDIHLSANFFSSGDYRGPSIQSAAV